MLRRTKALLALYDGEHGPKELDAVTAVMNEAYPPLWGHYDAQHTLSSLNRLKRQGLAEPPGESIMQWKLTDTGQTRAVQKLGKLGLQP